MKRRLVPSFTHPHHQGHRHVQTERPHILLLLLMVLLMVFMAVYMLVAMSVVMPTNQYFPSRSLSEHDRYAPSM